MAMPTSGTYVAGYYVKETNPTIQGLQGKRYIVNGWRRLTTGSTHVLNTDWLPDQQLIENIKDPESQQRYSSILDLITNGGTPLDGTTVDVLAFYDGALLSTTSTVSGGGKFVWVANAAKSLHDGIEYISPTVPWNGTSATLSAWFSKTGETQPGGNGCWRRSLKNSSEIDATWAGVVIGEAVGNDCYTSVTAAMNKVAATGGGVVKLPAGVLLKLDTSPPIVQKNKVTLKGAGRGATILRLVNNAGVNRLLGTVSIAGAVEKFSVEDITFEGDWAIGTNTLGSTNLVAINYVDDLRIVNCEVKNSRSMGFIANYSKKILVDGCHVDKTNGDGIALWASSSITVTNCDIRNCGDDAISCHTNDSDTAPLRGSIVITNNKVNTSQGIKALGAKNLVISNNSMSRIWSYAFYVGHDTFFNQGNTSNHSVRISSNVVNDVFKRPHGGNQEQQYVFISGGNKNAGSYLAAPGEAITSTGLVQSVYGTGLGEFQNNNTDLTTVSSPGGYNIIISDNIFARTLPAVAAYSELGFGTMFSDDQGTGEYDGPLLEANLNTKGMVIKGYLKNVLIKDNIFDTSAPACLFFDIDSTTENNIFENFHIRGNTFRNYTTYGVRWESGNISNQDIYIEDNLFDADPYFLSTNRGLNGTWLVSGAPFGVYFFNVSGINIRNNRYRNMSRPVVLTNSAVVIENETYYCDPTSIGFSTSNKGIGHTERAGLRFKYVIQDSDPQSATFKTILNATLPSSSTMPTTGKYVAGHFVQNTSPTLDTTRVDGRGLLGWQRWSTGSNHVINTDWIEVRADNGTIYGGTVTQATSKTTGVTLNRPTGAITMHAAALAANTAVSFVVTNSTVTATDSLSLGFDGSGPASQELNYRLAWSVNSAGGGFTVVVQNISAGSLSEAVKLRFAVIKSSNS